MKQLFFSVVAGSILALAAARSNAEPRTTDPTAVEFFAPAPRFELPGPPSAPDAAAKKKATELEKHARDLTRQGDCAGALPVLAEAYATAGADSALEASLACRESQGELPAAYDLATELLRGTPEKAKSRPAREAKVAELAQKTTLLTVTLSERHVELEVDGARLNVPHGDQKGVFRLMPGAHTLRATKQHFEPFSRTVDLAAGQSAEAAITLVELPLPVTPSVDQKQVLDFCYLTPNTDALRSQKQRLVLFRLAGRDVADGPEKELDEKGKEVPGALHHVMRDVGIHDHLRSVFLSTILMDRFYTVETSVESPKALIKKPFLTDDEMIGAASVDSFAAYSLACTDWVALPRLVGKEASWQKIKITETKGKQKVDRYEWQLNLVWKVEADIYRRSPKGFEWRATVEGNNGGLFGIAMALSELAPQKGGGVSPPQLSKRPAPGCNPPLLGDLAHLGETALDCKDALLGLGKLAEHVLQADGTSDAELDSGAPTDPAVAEASAAAEGAGERAGKDEAKRAAEATGVEHLKSAEQGAAAEVGKVPGANEAISDMASRAAAGTGATEAARDVEGAISVEERAALQALAGADPAAVDRLLALEGSVKNSAVLKLIMRAKHAFDSCKKATGAIQEASDKLRTLSQQGPAALGVPALVGLASCAGIDLAPDLSTASAPGAEQRHSKFCENVQRDAALGEAAMKSIAVCEGRVAMEHAALAVQKDVKRMRGIRLFGTLLNLPGLSPSLFGIALGTQEGVHRGDIYVAVSTQPDGTSVENGFGRIQVEGPGGPGAVGNPSQFIFRSGAADAGTRMEEHAQIGVPLGVRPLARYYFFKGQLKTTVAYGAALEGGYDASRYIPVAHEVWGRASVAVAAGAANELFVDAEIGPEVVHYLGAGFAAYGGAGFDVEYATKKVDTSPTQHDNVSGINYGALLTLGLDYAITPDWDARLSAAYRQGGGSTKLENSSKTLSLNASSLSSLQGGIAAGYTF